LPNWKRIHKWTFFPFLVFPNELPNWKRMVQIGKELRNESDKKLDPWNPNTLFRGVQTFNYYFDVSGSRATWKNKKKQTEQKKTTEKKHIKNRLADFITGGWVINLFWELAYFNCGGCINRMWTLYICIYIYCMCVCACLCVYLVVTGCNWMSGPSREADALIWKWVISRTFFIGRSCAQLVVAFYDLFQLLHQTYPPVDEHIRSYATIAHLVWWFPCSYWRSFPVHQQFKLPEVITWNSIFLSHDSPSVIQ